MKRSLLLVLTGLMVCSVSLAVDEPAKKKKDKPKKEKVKKEKIRGQTHQVLSGDETIITTMYTVHNRIMKMTAVLDWKSEEKGTDVVLEIKKGGSWKQIAKSQLILDGYSAHFRVENWDDTKDVEYRVRHAKHAFGGTIRHNPVEKETIVLAGFTGNAGKPDTKADIVENINHINPDLLVFTGDQVYGNNHYQTFPENFCLPFRDLLRNYPSVLLPDDHDVGQGNLWGDSGRNYTDPPYAVMVERVQTFHLPDPYDPTPVENGIGVYYTSLNVGRVGVAVVEDRKFKSNHKDFGRDKNLVMATETDFDPKKYDHPDAVLYGPRQIEFLTEWAKDWKNTDVKVVTSQTVLANVFTFNRGSDKIGDFDSNGWPQSGRNRAIDAIRRGFGFVLCGDQHLGSITQHGIDEWNDAGYQFCVPSIQNYFPRAWLPKAPGNNHVPGMPDYTGEYLDGFGNKITVWAVSNPKEMNMGDKIHDKAPGYGIVRINCKTRKITMECWPRYAVLSDPDKRTQYHGWPMEIDQEDNYGRKAIDYLPEIEVTNCATPVIQVIDESSKEVVYTIRARTNRYKAKVFRKGVYTVKVSEPDKGLEKTIKGLLSGSQKGIKVSL